MKAPQRRLLFGSLFASALLVGSVAYLRSLVPATHPDHDHGIQNLDAGGRLEVIRRDGSSRNLVGKPGKVLVLHFLSPAVPDQDRAVEELRGFFALTEKRKDVEVLHVVKAKDFATLDAWLASRSLTPPDPSAFVLDPEGETTVRFNARRPLETMYFTADGKLAAQARGAVDFLTGAADEAIARALGGTSIE